MDLNPFDRHLALQPRPTHHRPPLCLNSPIRTPLPACQPPPPLHFFSMKSFVTPPLKAAAAVQSTMSRHIDHSKYSQLYPNMLDDNYLKISSIRFSSVQFEENMSRYSLMFTYHQSSVLKVFTCSRKEKKRCKNNISGLIL
jgi:hypothetical protein